MTRVKRYLSLVKFSHTIFAMPFALIGFVLGVRHELQSKGTIESNWWIKFILVLVCMVSARSAAMAFNRFLDRHFDSLKQKKH
jgi:4-hydroxybenzoate polyprenyltransferase